jgi:C4-dicarboxylate transporter, DctQ subunit
MRSILKLAQGKECMNKLQKPDAAAPTAAIKKIGGMLGRAVDVTEVFVLSAGTGALALLLLINVIARTFFRSIYYAEELSEVLITIVTFVGVSYAARKARHIRMGAILEAFPARLEKVLVVLISGISAVVMFVLAYHSYRYLMFVKTMEQTTPSLRIPYWIFLIIVPIGFFMAGFQYVRTVIKNFAEKEVWLSPEQQSEYEEEAVMMARETMKEVEEEIQS